MLELLASIFPTVEILEVHKNLKSLVLELIYGEIGFFMELEELHIVAEDDRQRGTLRIDGSEVTVIVQIKVRTAIVDHWTVQIVGCLAAACFHPLSTLYLTIAGGSLIPGTF